MALSPINNQGPVNRVAGTAADAAMDAIGLDDLRRRCHGPRARVLVAQIGARRHYAVPRAFAQAGLLEQLVTNACADIAPWRWLAALLPAQNRPAILRGLLGRHVRDVPRRQIRGFPVFALTAGRDRRRGEAKTDFWLRRNSAFCRHVVKAGFGKADTVYCFNGAALEIFQAARSKGMTTILDQTAAPWRWNTALLSEECERWPGWEEMPAEADLSGRLIAREEAEWDLADRIICGSEFAAAALADTGGPRQRCAIVPYPTPASPPGTSLARPHNRHHGGPLRILFVGTLQLRKGVQYLLAAKRLLQDTDLTIRLVGPSQLSGTAMRDLGREMQVVGQVARADMAAQYAWADVFVLPTLSEGAANVCFEAMAAGLPVITTANAGGAVRDGVDGMIVPARDAAALADAIEAVASHGAGRGLPAGRAENSMGRTRGIEDYARGLADALNVAPMPAPGGAQKMSLQQS